jgi:5-methyltetrahydropteroyltriglutamate--homocysteine methyltransferase
MSSFYRADHVGSFLRPAELLEARRPQIPLAELSALEDLQIQRVLNKQKELGFGIFTDGELRRTNFMSDFTDAVEGFDLRDAVARNWEENSQTSRAQSAPVSSITGIVTSRLRQREPLTGHELPFLREHAPGPIKMTLPSATQFPAISFKHGVTDAAYRDPFELLDAITRIMASDVRTLAAGISYLQIDAPRYSYYLDPKWTAWMEKELRVDPAQMLTASLNADNACFAAARQPGVTLAIHLCRGNNRSHWYAEGGYDAIAERLFHELAVDRFLLEYDDERSGNFEPLRFVPQEKVVVLGLISTKHAALERKQDVLRRIDEAAKILPLEQLALSPQCGFASTMEGNLLTEADQWAKLQLVTEVAREVWG